MSDLLSGLKGVHGEGRDGGDEPKHWAHATLQGRSGVMHAALHAGLNPDGGIFACREAPCGWTRVDSRKVFATRS